MNTDLEQNHFSLRITTNIINLLRAVERYFGGNDNYSKGKGAEFTNWMNRIHPTAYLYAVSWACGGSRKDIGVEGSIAVLMNVPYYLDFLIWRMRCGHGDFSIERNLFMLLRSSKMTYFLRVPSMWEYTIHTYENTQYVRIFPRKLCIHDTYVREYTTCTDFSVQITWYDTQCVRIFPRKLHNTVLSTYGFPIQITRYGTLYVRISHTNYTIRTDSQCLYANGFSFKLYFLLHEIK